MQRHLCRARAIALLVVLHGSSVRAADSMRVHFIDVGQGAATLVELPCGAVLIDTGGERWPTDEPSAARYDSNVALYSYLNRFFNQRPELGRRLSALFLTHPHKDHTRGVPMVLEEFRPRNIVFNGQPDQTENPDRPRPSGIKEQNLARDYARDHQEEGIRAWYVLEDHAKKSEGGLTNGVIDPLDCSAAEADATDPEIRVLWGQVRNGNGWDAEDFADANNHSLVIRIDYGAASILFTGDLEENRSGEGDGKAGIERLIDKYSGTTALDVDVLHVGHHGSHNGNSTALAKRVSPQIAVIASGPACRRPEFSAWEHAHPRLETVDELLPEISGTRGNVTIRYFERHAVDPSTRAITKALYGTGWDGTIVLEAGPDGNWREVSLSGADLCLL